MGIYGRTNNMSFTSWMRRFCQLYLKATDKPEPKEPKLNEAQRRTVAEIEAKREMRIEAGAYARPKSQGLTDADLDYLQDFKGGQKLLERLRKKKVDE